MSGYFDFSNPSRPSVVGEVSTVLYLQYGDRHTSRHVVACEREDFLAAVQRVANELFDEVRQQEAQVKAG